jgi:hypothetical protein
MSNTITVSWFSAGVSSAVATWLMRDQLDHIIYCHIDDQEADTMRFVKDCEAWFGKPVTVLASPYKTVDATCRAMGYINGPAGAPCTRLLKRRVRAIWEMENRFFNTFRYVWGYDLNEQARASKMIEANQDAIHEFPLIDLQVTKEYAHGILSNYGIKRPRMYDLGYPNNNCIGCVKGGRGYWNKIRVDFPEVFKARCEMERAIGGSCLKKKRDNENEPAGEGNSIRMYLDELDPQAGRDDGPIVPECGAMCEAHD